MSSGPKLRVKLSHATPSWSKIDLHKQRKKELKDYLKAQKRIEKNIKWFEDNNIPVPKWAR